MTRSSEEIRGDFLQFFAQREHTFVPSSPLLPAEDPTLLFANAGMNQFKGVFLGEEKRPYTRAYNSQKCIRAGGKHNDLEDVGHDCYHHTFFEMLGNWSFGDYFKADAIAWAWDLLTNVWSLPKGCLYATVFAGDDADNLEPDTEAQRIWEESTDIDPSHILRGCKKDNFWEMGATGPCGPCSEIHIDLTDDGTGRELINTGDSRVIELWNLVFMQYSRDAEGVLTALPARHVDTGMGFERICAVLNGKRSNYATDLFVPIIEKIETLTDHRYGSGSGLADRFDATDAGDIRDVAFRVIADHARTLIFAITDGVIPSNEGRGYVLRRILRRAARYARQYLHIEGAFLVKLVPTITDMMGQMFPEIVSRRQYVTETIADEEKSFARTLDRGIDLFQRQADKLASAGRKRLSGEVAFDLYATFGFPVDLTQIMAAEQGLTVDMAGYERAMVNHRLTSQSDSAFKTEQIPDLPETDDSAKLIRGYTAELAEFEATVLGWVVDGQFVTTGELTKGDKAAVVLDKTCFYAEQGGQEGDTGFLINPATGEPVFEVNDTKRVGKSVLHVGTVMSDTLAVGDVVEPTIHEHERIGTERNHTATHLLNWALRRVLGEHISQAGSIVGPNRLRFDFSHNKALSADELAEVERLVNERILDDDTVQIETMPLAKAKEIPGVQAVFGEKYPDPVRVVAMGAGANLLSGGDDVNIEFCGGTHLERTGRIGLFKILSEESVAKGIRRITAVTGEAAVKHMQTLAETVSAAGRALRVPPNELVDRVKALQKEVKELKKTIRGGGGGKTGGSEFNPRITLDSPEGKILIGRIDGADAAAMRKECDRQRQKGAAAMMIGSADGGKVTLIAMVTETLAGGGKFKAGLWVKAAAEIVGGSGGGKDTMAQAGGKKPEKLDDALITAGEWAKQQLQ